MHLSVNHNTLSHPFAMLLLGGKKISLRIRTLNSGGDSSSTLINEYDTKSSQPLCYLWSLSLAK